MLEFDLLLAKADKAVLVWSMGITQHTQAEDTVQSIINLGLARGYLGREGCGLMPIRGHSGVQGGAEMGAYASVFPGGVPIHPETAAALAQRGGFPVPSQPGLSATEMLEEGLEVLWSVGGNFLETLPSPARAEAHLARVPLRVHQDIVLSSQMLVEPAEEVILLPATTRYEIPGGCTQTSTERRVIFSPEIPGPRIGEARWEGQVFQDVVARVCRPELAEKVRFADTAAVRAEIARVVPLYDGIQHLRAKGDAFQYGGPQLCPGGVCPTSSGRARFLPVTLPRNTLPEGAFRLVTRRGKQFNSMVQEPTDPINGAPRDAVLINPGDLHKLGLKPGQRVWLHNAFGTLSVSVFPADVFPGSVQVHWPEGNVLVDPALRSSQAKIPAYKEAYVYIHTQPPPQSPLPNAAAAG
jgi:anaerobic selenocysteine-containing dehydrogenase